MKKRFQHRPVALQVIVLVALGAMPAAGFFFIGVRGLSRRVDTLRMVRDRLKAENDKCEVFKKQAAGYLKQTEELMVKTETLQTIVPDERETGQLLRTVSGAARRTSVHILSFEARPPVIRDFYVQVPFTAKVEGTYQSLLSFFDLLCHQQRIVGVQSLSLGPPEGRVGANHRLGPGTTLLATCVLTTYYNTPPPARPGAR